MARWYVDEGLQRLIDEWKREFPRATVYTIRDSNHSPNPRVTQHAPDDGKSGGAGDDKGEVDAADFMPGRGVTKKDLSQLFWGLQKKPQDKRLLYVIYDDMIFNPAIQSGAVRDYKGARHGHVHVSVNDLFDDNTSDWHWEKLVARSQVNYTEMSGKLPELIQGDDDDAISGWNHIVRAQALMNLLEKSLPDLDIDGVYGAKTSQKLAKIMENKEIKTTSNGTKLYAPEWRSLIGFTG